MAKTLHAVTSEQWRSWLVENHARENEIWLVYFKKHTGKDRVSYNDAVEQALCFGWIDSIVRRIDEDRYIFAGAYSFDLPNNNTNNVNATFVYNWATQT